MDNTPRLATASNEIGSLYIELVKKCVADLMYEHSELVPVVPHGLVRHLIARLLARRGLQIVRRSPVDPETRLNGSHWPLVAHTMIGKSRLDNLQDCIKDVLISDVPGDLIETGVWRGGATIFMRAILRTFGVTDRKVWVADSFEGVPPPDPVKYPRDYGDEHHTVASLAVSLEEVMANFARYGLLDDQVQFLKGWFRDTLPRAPIDKVAVMRLDGDMYESTMDAFTSLYPRLSVGGYVIIDDYGAVPACKRAVHDFRQGNRIEDALMPIDWTGVYWKRSQ